MVKPKNNCWLRPCFVLEQQIDKVHVILIIEFICAMAYA